MISDLREPLSELLGRIRAEGHVHWWLSEEVSALFEEYGYYLVPHHYYGPLPTPAEIAATRHDIEKYPIGRLGFSPEQCERTFRALLRYWEEFKTFAQESEKSTGYVLRNPFYTGLDAFLLYALVREHRPGHVLEVGSGFSTHITCAAMNVNGHGRVTCIEPYPTPKLRELEGRVNVVESRAQDMDLELFMGLREHDFCFIDSSHVSRLDSDVNFEIMNVLPRLAPGVRVHIHDTFLPYEYPRHWLERRWFWNEQYLLYAFLVGDNGAAFRIELPVYWMLVRFGEELKPMSGEVSDMLLSGSGFWMVRRGATG